MTRSTPPAEKSRLVMVCDACLCASCWHGDFECDEAPFAGTVRVPVSELDRLGRENPSHYGAQARRGTG